MAIILKSRNKLRQSLPGLSLLILVLAASSIHATSSMFEEASVSNNIEKPKILANSTQKSKASKPKLGASTSQNPIKKIASKPKLVTSPTSKPKSTSPDPKKEAPKQKANSSASTPKSAAAPKKNSPETSRQSKSSPKKAASPNRSSKTPTAASKPQNRNPSTSSTPKKKSSHPSNPKDKPSPNMKKRQAPLSARANKLPSMEEVSKSCLPSISVCGHSERIAQRLAISVAKFMAIEGQSVEVALSVGQEWLQHQAGQGYTLDKECFWPSFKHYVETEYLIVSRRMKKKLCTEEKVTKEVDVVETEKKEPWRPKPRPPREPIPDKPKPKPTPPVVVEKNTTEIHVKEVNITEIIKIKRRERPEYRSLMCEHDVKHKYYYFSRPESRLWKSFDLTLPPIQHYLDYLISKAESCGLKQFTNMRSNLEGGPRKGQPPVKAVGMYRGPKPSVQECGQTREDVILLRRIVNVVSKKIRFIRKFDINKPYSPSAQDVAARDFYLAEWDVIKTINNKLMSLEKIVHNLESRISTLRLRIKTADPASRGRLVREKDGLKSQLRALNAWMDLLEDAEGALKICRKKPLPKPIKPVSDKKIVRHTKKVIKKTITKITKIIEVMDVKVQRLREERKRITEEIEHHPEKKEELEKHMETIIEEIHEVQETIKIQKRVLVVLEKPKPRPLPKKVIKKIKKLKKKTVKILTKVIEVIEHEIVDKRKRIEEIHERIKHAHTVEEKEQLEVEVHSVQQEIVKIERVQQSEKRIFEKIKRDPKKLKVEDVVEITETVQHTEEEIVEQTEKIKIFQERISHTTDTRQIEHLKEQIKVIEHFVEKKNEILVEQKKVLKVVDKCVKLVVPRKAVPPSRVIEETKVQLETKLHVYESEIEHFEETLVVETSEVRREEIRQKIIQISKRIEKVQKTIKVEAKLLQVMQQQETAVNTQDVFIQKVQVQRQYIERVEKKIIREELRVKVLIKKMSQTTDIKVIKKLEQQISRIQHVIEEKKTVIQVKQKLLVKIVKKQEIIRKTEIKKTHKQIEVYQKKVEKRTHLISKYREQLKHVTNIEERKVLLVKIQKIETRVIRYKRVIHNYRKELRIAKKKEVLIHKQQYLVVKKRVEFIKKEVSIERKKIHYLKKQLLVVKDEKVLKKIKVEIKTAHLKIVEYKHTLHVEEKTVYKMKKQILVLKRKEKKSIKVDIKRVEKKLVVYIKEVTILKKKLVETKEVLIKKRIESKIEHLQKKIIKCEHRVLVKKQHVEKIIKQEIRVHKKEVAEHKVKVKKEQQKILICKAKIEKYKKQISVTKNVKIKKKLLVQVKILEKKVIKKQKVIKIEKKIIKKEVKSIRVCKKEKKAAIKQKSYVKAKTLKKKDVKLIKKSVVKVQKTIKITEKSIVKLEKKLNKIKDIQKKESIRILIEKKKHEIQILKKKETIQKKISELITKKVKVIAITTHSKKKPKELRFVEDLGNTCLINHSKTQTEILRLTTKLTQLKTSLTMLTASLTNLLIGTDPKQIQRKIDWTKRHVGKCESRLDALLKKERSLRGECGKIHQTAVDYKVVAAEQYCRCCLTTIKQFEQRVWNLRANIQKLKDKRKLVVGVPLDHVNSVGTTLTIA